MFHCCSIAKNTIRFSFSHSLTSLFCFALFFPATYMLLILPHSLAFARLALLILFASSSLSSHHSFHSYSYYLPPLYYSFFSSINLPLSEHPFCLCGLHSLFTLVVSTFDFSSISILRPPIFNLSYSLLHFSRSSLWFSNSLWSSLPHPLSLFSPRGCWESQYGFCSMRLSGCFSTRRTRTVSNSREPSGDSALLPEKCKPPCTQCQQALCEWLVETLIIQVKHFCTIEAEPNDEEVIFTTGRFFLMRALVLMRADETKNQLCGVW